jgi:FMN phosphatase YigB (HAD superfamily)
MIHLFSKPAWELEDLEGDLPENYSEKLRQLGEELKVRLNEVADVFDKLVKNGWQPCGTLYDINFVKDVTMKEAEKELRKLGLQDYIENLNEIEEEEEWEEEE